jgi:hypothetical protein
MLGDFFYFWGDFLMIFGRKKKKKGLVGWVFFIGPNIFGITTLVSFFF